MEAAPTLLGDGSGAAGMGEPALSIRNLSKTFGATRALAGVSLEIRPGTVHALVGQNGSGKSTLIKILAGFHSPDAGAEILIHGRPLSPGSSENLRFVHQELGVVLELGAADNLALRGGYLRSRWGGVDWRAQERAAGDLLAKLDVVIDVRRPLREVAPVDRVAVAIAAALQGWSGRGILVLDEPTAVLPHHEVERLLALVREARGGGASVLYVSHRLDEIFEIADEVTVLRDGGRVATVPIQGLTKSKLVSLMLGRAALESGREQRSGRPAGPPALRLRGAAGRFLRGVDLEVQAGEIVGLAGLPGSGREELPYAIAGAAPGATGELRLAQDSAWRPVGRRDRRVAFVPADRAVEGLVHQMTVAENLSLSVLDSLASRGRLDRRAEDRLVESWAERLELRMPGAGYSVDALSGGNQQKVVIGRVLARQPSVLVLAEPTAGVDVGARRAIFDFILAEARRGLAVIVASSDEGDLSALCDRVVVLRGGTIAAELRGAEVDDHAIVRAQEGVVAE